LYRAAGEALVGLLCFLLAYRVVIGHLVGGDYPAAIGLYAVSPPFLTSVTKYPPARIHQVAKFECPRMVAVLAMVATALPRLIA
jgi:hypothetical protein